MPADPGPGPAERAPARRGRRWSAGTVVVGAVMVGVLWVTGANLYLISSSRAAVVDGVAAAPAMPYAMVLGSRVFGRTPNRELAARLETGRELYRAGLARRLIVSGAAYRGYDEPDAMAGWLEARGVPTADVIVDRGGHRTAASMADAVRLGVRSLLVVSQGYHLPRALYLARHAGIAAVGVPAREVRRSLGERLFTFVRETTARAEVIVEVALRGVRGLAPGQIPRAATN